MSNNNTCVTSGLSGRVTLDSNEMIVGYTGRAGTVLIDQIRLVTTHCVQNCPTSLYGMILFTSDFVLTYL